MSVTKRIAFGAAASWFSRGITILLGLVLLPVLFRHLPKEELGVWLLLGQSWAAMGILDLGVGITLTRRIAMAKGKSGGDPEAQLTEESKQEIADLVACGRRIYRFMAVGVFLVTCGLGFLYLRNLQLNSVSLGTAWLAWAILCAAQGFTVWGTVWTCLLQGVGYVGWDAIIASFVQAAMLTAQMIAVLCGGGLIALATLATFGAITQRFLTRWLARRRKPELFALKGNWNPKVLQGMTSLAFRAWLTAVGTMFIFNSDQFFIASAQGAEKIPAYRAAYLVVLNLNMLAITFASSSTVFVSCLWQACEFKQVHRVVQRNLRLGLLIMLSGAACVIALGSSLFDAWIGPGKFIGFPTLIVFTALLVFETHSFIIVASSRATEDEAFVVSTLTAGILKLCLSWLLMQRYGLLGIASGTLIAQLLTNNWFMAFRGLRRLRMSLRDHFQTVIMPVTGTFILILICDVAVLKLFSNESPLTHVLAAGVTTAVLLALSCWVMVLAKSERDRIRSFFRLLTFPAKSSKA